MSNVNPRVAGGFTARYAQLQGECAQAELRGNERWARDHGRCVFATKRALRTPVPRNADALLDLLPPAQPCSDQRLAPLAVTRKHVGGTKPVAPPPPAPCPPPPAMLPVQPCTRCLLYVGVCKDGRGRCQYLKRRYRDLPADRWRAPPTVNSTYGWRARPGPGADGLLHPDERFPRTAEGRREFFRRRNQHPYTGPQRAPLHLLCTPRPTFL